MSSVAVIGGGIAAYAAALDLAEVGVQVWLADEPADLPMRGVRDTDGEVEALLEQLAQPIASGGPEAPGLRPVRTQPARVQLRDASGKWKPLPDPAICGIPAVPLSADTIALLGTGSAMRAFLDRVKPVLTIGKEQRFEKLVSSRVGRAVADRLAAPVLAERFGVSMSHADVALVAPGLNEALTRVGSLTGAVQYLSERNVARETLIAPVTGWESCRAALEERLFLYGAQRLPAQVVSLNQADTGGWILRDSDGRDRQIDAVISNGAVVRSIEERFAEDIAALAPMATRAFAEAAISAPPSGVDGALATLELCEVEPGVVWSVRTEPQGDGTWLARISGPATTAPTVVSDPRTIRSVLERVGLAVRDDAPRAWTETAPFTEHAVRDPYLDRLASWCDAHPDILLASEQYHGAELAPALADARLRATQLRRRLTGIAE